MREITVFADVSCPFAHVGLTRISAYRSVVGPDAPALRCRAWPLELVNGAPLSGLALAPKVEALRRGVAPDLFAGFDPVRFPTTTLPALAVEASAYRVGVAEGLHCALALRRALFEEGADIGDESILGEIGEKLGLPAVTARDEASVMRDHAEGVALAVQGSPHFFTGNGDFFCPTLDIRHNEDAYEIEFNAAGFQQFISAAFG